MLENASSRHSSFDHGEHCASTPLSTPISQPSNEVVVSTAGGPDGRIENRSVACSQSGHQGSTNHHRHYESVLPPEQEKQQDVIQRYHPLIAPHVNTAQSAFEHSPFGSPITFMQANTVRNLEDQLHSQPATENSLSRQKHGNPKMLPDKNAAGDMFLSQQLGQSMALADSSVPQNLFKQLGQPILPVDALHNLFNPQQLGQPMPLADSNAPQSMLDS